jgi:hypothetical protein
MVCRDYHAQRGLTLRGPLAAWHVGRDFGKEEPSILFAGKVARGAPGDPTPCGFLDPQEAAELLYESSRWSFWSYTREIAERVHGDGAKAWERIALTNMLKCDWSDTVDISSEEMKRCCIGEHGVVWREIEFLEPSHVVFYTGRDHDPYLEGFIQRKSGEGWSVSTVHPASHRIANGARHMWWWETTLQLPSGRTMRLLRTSHPERQKRDGFVGSIVNWIL